MIHTRFPYRARRIALASGVVAGALLVTALLRGGDSMPRTGAPPPVEVPRIAYVHAAHRAAPGGVAVPRPFPTTREQLAAAVVTATGGRVTLGRSIPPRFPLALVAPGGTILGTRVERGSVTLFTVSWRSGQTLGTLEDYYRRVLAMPPYTTGGFLKIGLMQQDVLADIRRAGHVRGHVELLGLDSTRGPTLVQVVVEAP